MYKQFFVLSIMVCMVVYGCDGSVFDVAGSYRIEYPYGEEQLVLREGGRYLQIITLNKQDDSIRHEGNWEYQSKDSKVLIYDPLIVDDGFGRLSPDYSKVKSGIGIYFVYKSWAGKIRLRVNEDLGLFYEKVNDETGQR